MQFFNAHLMPHLVFMPLKAIVETKQRFSRCNGAGNWDHGVGDAVGHKDGSLYTFESDLINEMLWVMYVCRQRHDAGELAGTAQTMLQGDYSSLGETCDHNLIGFKPLIDLGLNQPVESLGGLPNIFGAREGR